MNAPLVTAADQLSVPPPLFETLTDWPRGPPPPATAENDNDVGVTLIMGVGAGLTVSVAAVLVADPALLVATAR